MIKGGKSASRVSLGLTSAGAVRNVSGGRPTVAHTAKKKPVRWAL